MKSETPQNVDVPCQEEHSSNSVKPRSCCAPRLHREELVSQATPALAPSIESRDRVPDSNRSVISLPGGTFFMGTNYAHGFPADGEGPVRPVSLSAFDIDTFPV
ncbi:MAG TPA: hypothetical protein VK638_57320, partial [Edaphobacter sp.]|nr:hypothetical protein [Edaphobacter sp.]